MRRCSPWMLLPLLFLSSCDDGETSEESGASGSTTQASDGATTSPTATESATMATAGDGTAAETGAPIVPCTSAADCGSMQYCDFPDQSCGISNVPGACTDRPVRCAKDPRPVCACDGQIYDSVCHAAAAGQDLEFLAECTPPAGAFACGYSFCIGGKEYCFQTGGAMPTFECIELPPVCDPGDCFCMTSCCGCQNATCCNQYCKNADGQTTITCPG